MRILGVIPYIKLKKKKTLFIRTKHNMRILGVIPYIKLK